MADLIAVLTDPQTWNTMVAHYGVTGHNRPALTFTGPQSLHLTCAVCAEQRDARLALGAEEPNGVIRSSPTTFKQSVRDYRRVGHLSILWEGVQHARGKHAILRVLSEATRPLLTSEVCRLTRHKYDTAVATQLAELYELEPALVDREKCPPHGPVRHAYRYQLTDLGRQLMAYGRTHG